MKAAQRASEVADAQGYTAGTSGATLGDVMRDKLKGLGGAKKTKKQREAEEEE
jgi:hypothetical protein